MNKEIRYKLKMKDLHLELSSRLVERVRRVFHKLYRFFLTMNNRCARLQTKIRVKQRCLRK